MKKIFIAATLIVLGLAALGVGQSQTDPSGFRPAQGRCGYWIISDVGLGAAWFLDSAQIDTSVIYHVIPGLYYTLKVSSGATADTLDQVYVYANMRPTIVEARLIDSTGVVGGTTPVWRDLHGGVAGLKYPVMARYLIFTANNDDLESSADADAVIELISSPMP